MEHRNRKRKLRAEFAEFERGEFFDAAGSGTKTTMQQCFQRWTVRDKHGKLHTGVDHAYQSNRKK